MVLNGHAAGQERPAPTEGWLEPQNGKKTENKGWLLEIRREKTQKRLLCQRRVRRQQAEGRWFVFLFCGLLFVL